MNLKDKGTKALWLLLKVSTVIICGYYIYYKLNSNNIQYTDLISNLRYNNSPTLLLVFLLMPVNWLLEAFKWKTLTSQLESISATVSLKSVLAGITSSLFTPNRVGDFLGKIMSLKKENRNRGISLSFYGSYIQLLVTLVFGVIGLSLLKTKGIFHIPSCALILSYFIVILSILLLIFTNKLSHIIPDKFIMINQVFKSINMVQKINIIIYSVARYITFSIQFYLLLIFFGVKITILNAAIAISSIYFLTSIIPTITLAELGIREVTSIEILQHFDNAYVAILYATLSLWIVNLVLPAIVGSFFLIKSKTD